MPDVWLDVDAAVTVLVNKVHFTDDTDFKTREESVVYNQSGLDLTWIFTTTAGVISQTAVTPTDTAGVYDWTALLNGFAKIEIPASGGGTINNDTEGFGYFEGFATGILAWVGPTYGFRPALTNALLIDDAFSATRGLAGTALPAAAADAAGGLPISDDGALDMDEISVILADTNELQAKFVGITLLNEWLGALAGKQASDATAQTEMRASGAGSGTYDATTDSQEANTDQLVVVDGNVDDIETAVGALNDISTADVNAEVVDVITVDTIDELAQGAPETNPNLADAMMRVYMALVHVIDVDASLKEFSNNAGTVIWKKGLSDDGTNYVEAEGETGP